MVKNQKMKLNLCLLYIMFVFMYGMVIKLTMSNNILFQVKTYIPKMMLGLIAVLNIILLNILHLAISNGGV